MTKQTTFGGRPTNVPLRGDLVRKRRAELGLSQAALVEKVYLRMGRRRVLELESLERQCRRWEGKGLISAVALEALASVLGHSTQYLQEGGAPGPAPDRLAEIKDQLREQVQISNPKALEFVRRVSWACPDEHPTADEHEQALSDAARAFELQLGSVQLSQRADQLVELGAVTGWGISELLKPAGSEGHWMVVTEGLCKTGAEIHRGSYAVLMAVLREAKDWIDGSSCDSRASLRDEAPWFRVDLEDPCRPHISTTISFVRFEPTATGVRWCSPTAYERWEVCNRIAPHLARDFNFVRNFGDRSPWPDPRRLRLELRDTSASTGASPPIARFQGAVDRMASCYLKNFEIEGSTYSAVTNWLTSDLEEDLLGYLAHWPRGCWESKTGECEIHILLETPLRVAHQLNRRPAYGRMFSIILVEEADDGAIRRVAWNDDLVAQAERRLSRALDALPDPPLADAEFIGPTRPIGAISN